jgi:hypothetical protein
MQSFLYKGIRFEPVRMDTPYQTVFFNWASERLVNRSLLDIKDGWSHEEFYKVPQKHECGKIDVFKAQDQTWIPTGYDMRGFDEFKPYRSKIAI